MDRFKEIEAFVTVVEEGSFVAAGDTLHVSKAAVSRAVLELEKRLGARLLQRTTRRLSITEAGRAYYDRCKQIMAELDEADSAVGAVTGTAVGKLRINAPVSFGIRHLSPVWGRFMKRYPNVELEIDLSDRIVDVVDEGFDAVIRISRLVDSTLVHRKLATTQIIAVASPGYIEAHGLPRHPEELDGHQMIGYAYAASGDVWRFESDAEGVVEVNTKPRARANNGDTCRSLILDDVGIGMEPDFLVADDLAAGRLVHLFPQFRCREIGIYVVYPSRKHLSVKVRALVDFLADAFREPPWSRAGGHAASD
ncbi:LysR family transcriptional regulator [Nitrogeniibacter aestuarii]|uniref:LysR family transcriptional regulator n=1 Tax=Nitrogeniibacter aestuarii TaxID=2815343 RepID=UPI001D0FEA61|nr:LysR family transcriptional regulator [Nitrogeniibacter aestuarii]